MADVSIDLDVSDEELFSGATAKEAPEVADQESVSEQPETEAKEEQRERDDKGRFVAKDAEPEAPAEQPAKAEQPDDDKTPNVPSWRLREIREERDRYAQRAAELERQSGAFGEKLQALEQALARLNQPQKPPAERVDFFSNPDEAFNQRVGEKVDPVLAEMRQIRQDNILRTSRTLAIALHGAPAVEEATNAVAEAMAQNNPEMVGLRARMLQTEDPVSEVMKWHRDRKVVAELSKFNGDVNAYRESILSEALKDKAFMAKAAEALRGTAEQNDAARGRPNVKMPTSLSRLAGSSANAESTDDADMSNEALAKYAFPQRRR